jgi:uncharacterized protein HemX
VVAFLLRAWTWTKANVTALLGVVVALFAALFFVNRERQKRLDAEAQAAVEKAKAEIAALQARKQALVERADSKTEEIEAVEKKIAENKRAIVAHHENVGQMTPKEIEDAFSRLGY